MRELSGIEESEDVPGSILPVTSDVEGEEENPESELPSISLSSQCLE